MAGKDFNGGWKEREMAGINVKNPMNKKKRERMKNDGNIFLKTGKVQGKGE